MTFRLQAPSPIGRNVVLDYSEILHCVQNDVSRNVVLTKSELLQSLTNDLSAARLAGYPGCFTLPMTTIHTRSFAKLNIALDVFDKRPDSYHNIESVIQSISLCDELTLSTRADTEITVHTTDSTIPSGRGNLVYSACVMFFKAAGLDVGMDIEIAKAIPAEAGLGGGSSNAAAALMSLNDMFGQPLGNAEMLKLGWNLGSDVPFFLTGGTTFVSGMGESVAPLPECPMDFVIVKPDFGVSTAWAYSRLAAERNWTYASRKVAEAVVNGERECVAASMANDFQNVVEQEFPEVAEIRNKLLGLGANGAILAGSGSAVFGVFLDEKRCDYAHKELISDYPRVFRARSVSQKELSPRELVRG